MVSSLIMGAWHLAIITVLWARTLSGVGPTRKHISVPVERWFTSICFCCLFSTEVLRVATELQKVNCSVLHLSLSPGELKSRVRGTMAVPSACCVPAEACVVRSPRLQSQTRPLDRLQRLHFCEGSCACPSGHHSLQSGSHLHHLQRQLYEHRLGRLR